MNEYKVRDVGAYNTTAMNEPTDRESEFSNTILLYTLKEEVRRLEDLFPDPKDIGPFSVFSKADNALGGFLRSIGLDSEELSHSVDSEYIYNRSGGKLLSRLVKNFIKKNNVNISGSYPISQLDFGHICDIMSIRFAYKWKRLYETVTADFDPLSPLNIVTDENIQNKLSSQRNNNDRKKSTYQNQQNETGNSSTDGTEKNNTYGFNGATSEDGEPRSKVISDAKSNYGTDTSEEGATSQTDERLEVYVRDNPITRKTTRSGNIGNISLQQLTNQQREMLQWQFWNVVFDDADTILTRGMF